MQPQLGVVQPTLNDQHTTVQGAIDIGDQRIECSVEIVDAPVQSPVNLLHQFSLLLLITARNHPKRDAAVHVERRTDLVQQHLRRRLLGNECIVRTHTAQHIMNAESSGIRQIHGLLQPHDLEATKPVILSQKLHQQGWQRAIVRRIEVEVRRSDHHVLWIGGFQDQQARWQQNAHRLLHELLQHLEGNVLGKLEPGHDCLRVVGQRLERGQGVLCLNS